MSAGAFSDPAVIEASKKIVCVFVDCDWGKKHKDLSDKFKVRGYPAVAFCDPDGNQVGLLGSREPAAVATQIRDVIAKFGKLTFETFEKGSEKAKEEKKPVLYVFSKPGFSSPYSAAVTDDSFKDLVAKFILVQSDITKENADAKAFSATEGALLVLDPAADAKQKPLLKLTGKKDTKEIRKQLEAALKKFEEGSGENK